MSHFYILHQQPIIPLLFFSSSFLLRPLLSNMWGNKKKSQFLKVLGAKKKQKKGCYLIKEAAINLSGSSAAPLHIWLLNSGCSTPATRCRSFWLSPDGIYGSFCWCHTLFGPASPYQRSHAGTGWPAGGDCGRGPSSVPGLHFFLGQGL